MNNETTEFRGVLTPNPNALAVYRRIKDPLDGIAKMGMMLFKSGMYGCKNLQQGMTLATTCQTEGVSPFRLKQVFHLIQGNLSMRADAMLAGLVKAGGTYKVKRRTPDNASIEITHRGESQTFNLSWKEAVQEPFAYETDNKGQPIMKATHLKKNWRTPRARMQMLWARVVSDGIRVMAPEVVAGHYTPEEMADSSNVLDAEYRVLEDPAGDDVVPDAAPDEEQSAIPIENGDDEVIDADYEPAESGDGKPDNTTSSTNDTAEAVEAKAPTCSPGKDSPEPAPQETTEQAPESEPSTVDAPSETATPEPEEPPPFATPETPNAEPVAMCNQEQMKEMLQYVQKLKIPTDRWRKNVLARYGVDRASNLTEMQAQEILDMLSSMASQYGTDTIKLNKELDDWAKNVALAK